MIIIGAMSKNRVIGAGAGMPWDVPEEYERYIETVRDGVVILGRKSYDIFAADLEGVATPIKVTRQADPNGDREAPSLEEALKIAEDLPGEVFVAGGANLYEQAMPLAEAMYLSTIHGEHEGDTLFPAFDDNAWRLVRFEKHDRYDFREYRRHGAYWAKPHRTLASRML